jgi:hypothetical protein
MWLVRRDEWPHGKWVLTFDPYAERWDWRVRVCGDASYMLRRYGGSSRELDRLHNRARVSRNLKAVREIVDKMRRGA